MRWYNVDFDYAFRPTAITFESSDTERLADAAGSSDFQTLRDEPRVVWSRDELEADPALRVILEAWEARDDSTLAHHRALEAAWSASNELSDAASALSSYSLDQIRAHAASDPACAKALEALSLVERALACIEPLTHEVMEQHAIVNQAKAQAEREAEKAEQPA
jgi:hypothetical protein